MTPEWWVLQAKIFAELEDRLRLITQLIEANIDIEHRFFQVFETLKTNNLEKLKNDLLCEFLTEIGENVEEIPKDHFFNENFRLSHFYQKKDYPSFLITKKTQIQNQLSKQEVNFILQYISSVKIYIDYLVHSQIVSVISNNNLEIFFFNIYETIENMDQMCQLIAEIRRN